MRKYAEVGNAFIFPHIAINDFQTGIDMELYCTSVPSRRTLLTHRVGNNTCLFFAGIIIFLCQIAGATDALPLKVVKANAFPDGGNQIQFHGVIEVQISGLADYLSSPAGSPSEPPKKPADFILFLDERPLPGQSVRRVSIAGENKDKLHFDLERTDNSETNDEKANHAGWNHLLGAPTIDTSTKQGNTRPVRVTVGLSDKPFDTTVVELKLVVANERWAWVGGIAIAILTISMFALALTSDLLRDAGPPETRQDPKGATIALPKPFSLARVQLAIWFWTIIVSFIFIWVMNGETGSLTPQVLGILGISTATMAASATVDFRNANRRIDELNQISDSVATKEKQAATVEATRITADATQKPALEIEKNRLNEDVDKLKKKAVSQMQESSDQRIAKGAIDILGDSNGVAFHRFQNLAWTLVVVIIFLEHVWRTLAMPQLSEYLLALMAMSSATYVGMKTGEVNNALGGSK